MPQVDRDGIYKVAPGGQHGLEESKDGAVAVAIRFDITHKLEGNDWIDWNYQHYVWARVWIITKKGTVNDRAIETLRDVLGWDGDLESVGTDRWQLPACQVVVKPDEYEGKTRYRVEWINPIDYVPDSKPKTAPADRVKALKAQFGSQLRALYGNRPVAAPAPKSAPPPLPPTNSAGRSATATLPPPPKPKGVHGTKQRAWAAFCEAKAPGGDPFDAEWLSKEWQRIYSMLFEDKPESDLKPADWLRMEQEGPAMILPF